MIAACLAMPSWPWPSNSITAATEKNPMISMRLQPHQRGWGVERYFASSMKAKVRQNTTINLDYNKSKVVMVMMVMMVMVEVMGMILSLGIFGGGKKNRGYC